MTDFAQEALSRFSTWLFSVASSKVWTISFLWAIAAIAIFTILQIYRMTMRRMAALVEDSISQRKVDRRVREEVARMIEHGTIRCSTSEDLAAAVRRGAKCHPECSECAGMKKPS